MNRETISRLIIFFIFFAAGISAMMGSLLLNDIYNYYHNKNLIAEAQRNVEKLKTLNDDYDDLLRQLRSDEHLGRRLASATLGLEPKEQGVAYPHETLQQLAAAKQALVEESEEQSSGEPALPVWLERCKSPSRRLGVFIAGAFLLVISFTYFGPQKQGT